MADHLHKQDNGALDGAQSDTETQLLNVPDSQISMDLNVQSLQGSSDQSPMHISSQRQNVLPFETFQHQIEDQIVELDGQMNGLSVQPTDGEDQKNQAGGAMSSSTSVTQNQQMIMMLGSQQLDQQQKRQDIPQAQAAIQQERYSQLRQRAQVWTAKIRQLEQDLALHNQQRGAMPEPTHQLKAEQYSDQIDRFKDDLHTMFNLIKEMAMGDVSSPQRMPSDPGDTNDESPSDYSTQNNLRQGPASSQSSQPPMMPDQAVNTLEGTPAPAPLKMRSADQIKPYVGLEAGRYPTEAELQQARLYKEQLLDQLIRPGINHMKPQHVPPEKESEYAAFFQELCGYASRVYPAFELIICGYPENVVKKVIAATMTAFRQKELSEEKGSPHYLIGLENIRSLTYTMKVAAQAIPYPGIRGEYSLVPL